MRWAAGGLTRNEVESVGYEWADPTSLLQRYAPATLEDGFNRLPTGGEILFVSNPGMGLWALREHFASA